MKRTLDNIFYSYARLKMNLDLPMKMILYFILTTLIFSCEKGAPVPIPEPQPMDSTYVLKWNTKLEFNHGYLTDWGFIYKNEFVIGAVDLDSVGHDRLISFDKFTGLKLWDFVINKEKGGWRGFANIVQKENILIISTLTGLFGYNIDTRSIIWSKVHEVTGEDGDRNLGVIDDYVYTEVSTGIYVTIGYKSKLVRFNVSTGQREDIYQYIHPKGWSVSYSQPVQFIDAMTGDTILLFKRYYSSSENAKLPSDLVAYNLSKKEVLWEQDAFSPLSSSEFYPSNIVGDDALVVSDNSVYKYDIMTGELLWKQSLGSNPNTLLGFFRMAQPTLYDGKLFLQENARPFYCIDVETGNVIWTNSDASSSPSRNMIINKDMIINCAGGRARIRGYDLANGFTFMSAKSPGEGGNETSVAYDAETDTYFSQDFHSAFAFKVNKPK